jgi:hypothetical protein
MKNAQRGSRICLPARDYRALAGANGSVGQIDERYLDSSYYITP